MRITLDQQRVQTICGHCGGQVDVVRGSVYAEQAPVGIYLVALHSCARDVRAHLGIATTVAGAPLAAAVRATPADGKIGFEFVDWDASPWHGESYLGQFLSRAEVLVSPLQSHFLHVAEHVVSDIAAVARFLGDDGNAA